MKVLKKEWVEYVGPVSPDPCPFCPASHTENDFQIRCEYDTGTEHGLARVFCRTCGAYGPYGQGLQGAIEAWNGKLKKDIGLDPDRRTRVLLSPEITISEGEQ